MVAFGVYSLFTINKDEFPTFQIKDGLVVGVYPGANAKEVEEQLTRPLEEILFKFAEVKRTTYSYTQDGICYILKIMIILEWFLDMVVKNLEKNHLKC